jgi:hypothetical protein
MDLSRYTEIVRFLGSVPSRRAVIRALTGLGIGSFLMALVSPHDAAAGEKHPHTHKPHRRKKRQKHPPQRCASGLEYCNAGEYSQCCSTEEDPESGERLEVCTDCGCCATPNSQCCASGGDGLCCPNDTQCCYANDFKSSACCSASDKCCGAGCCHQDAFCCQRGDGDWCCPTGSECMQDLSLRPCCSNC